MDGFLGKYDIECFLFKIKVREIKGEAKSLQRNLDLAKQGAVSYSDFSYAFTKSVLPYSEEAFQWFDIDGDGKISSSDFNTRVPSIEKEVVYQYFKDFEEDGIGIVEFKELLAV